MSGYLKGLVSCIRRYADAESTEYFLVLTDRSLRTISAKSKMLLKVGEFADVSISGSEVEKFDATDDAKGRAALEKEIAAGAKAMLKNGGYKTGVEKLDATTANMWKRLQAAMLLLARKLLVAAPIMIRFHNDIDGVSGAYALSKSLDWAAANNKGIGYKPNVHWRMHGSVSYSREDATSDILTCNNYECVEKPLLVVLDFGTAPESNEGIALIRERFDVIWLDHHPVLDEFEGKSLEHYINPWNFGNDSNYTAGFLTCVFAKCIADVDTRELEEASFIGDYSEYSKPTPASRKLAALLDLLTSDTRVISGMKGTLNPESLEAVIKDRAKSEELVAYAENRVSEMIDLALKSVKIYKTPAARIYVADFESIRINEQERYPLPGRFASKLLGKIEELNKEPGILILHFGHFISVRMSKELIGRVNLLKTLEETKSEHPNYVDSAGGHSNAASIKLKTDEMKKEIIKSTVNKLKDALDSDA